MIKKSKVIVSTTLYKSEHGVNPRGYGDWWFRLYPTDESKPKCTYRGLGMYSEMKAKAIEYAAENDFWKVKVLD